MDEVKRFVEIIIKAETNFDFETTMSNPGLIIVYAKISIKTSEEGGRMSGFKSGYRPNHVFEMPEDLKNFRTYIGDIIFDGPELIEPGETKNVTVRFLKIPEIERYITVGQKWFINEAAKTIGFGEILEIKS
jgi:translation elongation factor EF-Tu-like GTPase